MTMDTRFADTAFGRIEYLDRGQGHPVLVLHGAPGGHDQGSLMADFVVAAGLRAIIPSRPGYLGSELTELNRSFDGAADALAALMAGLGIDAYSVLCWSGGGPTAFRLALRHGERVHALVALAAASQRYDWHPDGGERFMFGTALGNWILKIMAEHAPRQLIGATLASEGELSKEDLETLVRQVWSDETKRRFVVELAATVSWRGARKPGLDNDMACFAAIDDLQLEHIQVPTLLVHGRADTDCPPQHSEAAARRIPGARLRWIEHGGHLAMFTDPDSDAVQADIVGFLRQP